MARARNIKPSFFQNEELAELNPLDRLFFIGLWTIADYKGCIEFRPKRLKIQILPYDDCDTEVLANNLERSGFLRMYSVEGKRYLKVVNFERHQNPHKNERDAGSEIPDFDGKDAQAIDSIEFEKNREQDGTNLEQDGTARADSLLLIPDSLLLNAGIQNQKTAQQAAPPVRKKKSDLTYQQFKDKCLAEGVKEMPAEHPVFDYADKTGIETDWLRIAYYEFTSKDPSKKYKDWRLAFMNCVKGNWMRLWYVGQDGKPALTTQGILAMKNYQERLNENG